MEESAHEERCDSKSLGVCEWPQFVLIVFRGLLYFVSCFQLFTFNEVTN